MIKKLMLVLMLALGLVSCDKKQAAIDDLRDFSVELKENGGNYSMDDWSRAKEKLEKIEAELGKYDDYTPEQRKEIGRLEGECLVHFAGGALESMDNALRDAQPELEGFAKGLEDAIKGK